MQTLTYFLASIFFVLLSTLAAIELYDRLTLYLHERHRRDVNKPKGE